MRVERIAAAIYGLLCLGALLMIPASAHGWFGMERDSLAGVYAVLLAMPWSLLVARLDDPGTATGAALLALGMLVNVAILLGLARLLSRRRRNRG